MALPLAAAIEIVGVVPPDETTGEVADTELTYVPAGCLLLNVVQSVEVKYPLTLPLAAGMDKWLEEVPDPVSGESDVTVVRYAPAGCLLLKVVQSAEVK